MAAAAADAELGDAGAGVLVTAGTVGGATGRDVGAGVAGALGCWGIVEAAFASGARRRCTACGGGWDGFAGAGASPLTADSGADERPMCCPATRLVAHAIAAATAIASSAATDQRSH